jgi:hypothetical protein
MGGISTKKIVLVIVTILSLAGMGSTVFNAKFAWAADKEIGPNEVQGKVMQIYTSAFRRGTIVVKSDQTGKTYTFYVGRRTLFIPHRYPNVGETIKVTYIDDRGALKVTQVQIIPSS